MKHRITLVLSAILFACTSKGGHDSAIADPLRVAVLPDHSLADLSTHYAPLMDYLEKTTSLELELMIPRDYQSLLDAFDAGDVHLAWFGGLTFSQAEEKNRAEPLIMRDVDRQFTSCYLVKRSDTRRSIAEFEGEHFSFGPTLSTSGHLMPRYFMAGTGTIPEQLFSSVLYSSGHDQTATWVNDGTVAIGVANCIIVETMFSNGTLDRNRIRILETTPPYADYVWAVQEYLDEDVKLLLLDAFLALDPSVPEHLTILRGVRANVYMPAGRRDFDAVRIAARDAGLLSRDPKD